MVPRIVLKALCLNALRIVVPLYHTWPMIKQTMTSEQRFPNATNLSYVFWNNRYRSCFGLSPAGPKVLRNSRNSDTVVPAWSWCPATTLDE